MERETLPAAGGLIKWFLLDGEDLSFSVSASQRNISKSASLKNISMTENKCSYFFFVIHYTREKITRARQPYISLPIADHISYIVEIYSYHHSHYNLSISINSPRERFASTGPNKKRKYLVEKE